ncbi:MAG: signal peptide peptidase SppA [Thermoprotei archaeon]|nr:MAG: signal peptide peptidase SppA [Thermoprotei archaeon]
MEFTVGGIEIGKRELIIIAAVFIILLIALASIAAVFVLPKFFKGNLESINQVALIKIEGPLAFRSSGYSILSPLLGVEDYMEMIDRARRDSTIKAVVLYVNSPGGSVAASEALYFAMERLAREKVVVAYVADYGTSGAYMAMLPAHKIVASNSSVTGAIGVYALVINYKGLLDKLGIEVYTFKSGKLKDVGSPFREMTEEDVKIYEEMVADFFEIFKTRVLKHRNIKSEEVFSGRPYTASKALKIGLIDEIGTYEDAVEEARRLAGLPEKTPIKELKPAKPRLLELLFGLSATGNIRVLPSQEVLAIWPPPTLALEP